MCAWHWQLLVWLQGRDRELGLALNQHSKGRSAEDAFGSWCLQGLSAGIRTRDTATT